MKHHAFQILVEIISTSQPVRQGHTYQTLVEFITKSQADKALWNTKKISSSNRFVKCVTSSKENSASKVSSPLFGKHHAACNWVSTKMSVRSTCQILETVRKRHAFQILVEILSRSQTVRQGHTYQTLVEFITKSQTDKALWKTKKISCSNGVVKCVTPSKENSASEVSSSIIKKHHAACN